MKTSLDNMNLVMAARRTPAGSTVDFPTGSKLVVPGPVAFGNDASIGPTLEYDGNTYDKIFDMSHTITDFSSSPYWSCFKSYIRLDPSVNIGTTSIYGHDLEIIIPAANDKNIGYVYGEYKAATNFGLGNVNTLVGAQFANGHSGSGTVANLVGSFVQNYANGSGDVGYSAGSFIVSGNLGSGTISQNYGQYISSPYTGGIIGENYGLYIENQIGAISNWAIYVVGGQSYFGSYVGIGIINPRGHLEINGNPTFILSDPDVTHPFTDYEATDIWSKVEMNSGVDGGYSHRVYVNGDNVAYFLSASIGSTNPGSAVAIFDSAKSDGATGKAALTGNEITHQFSNNSNPNLEILGDNTVKFYGKRRRKRTSTAISYTVLTTDDYIGVTNTAAPRTITLPASPIEGDEYEIFDESGNAAINNITINGNGNNIDNSATKTIATNYGGGSLMFTGTFWKFK